MRDRQILFPGLSYLLSDYLTLDFDVTREDFIRRLLRVLQQSHHFQATFQELYDQYDAEQRSLLDKFLNLNQNVDKLGTMNVRPSPGFRDEMSTMMEAVELEAHDIKSEMNHFLGRDSLGFEVYRDSRFQNWGRTVTNTPKYTCLPTKVSQMQEIVKFAKYKEMGIRVSGYRHSWSPLFSENGQILISLLSLDRATVLPNTECLPSPWNVNRRPATELETIDVVKELPSGRKWVRIGSATTNERLRQWCNSNKTVTIPINVIMVEITVGGSNAPICHAAGRRNQTLSDLVRRIEYIDAHGEQRIIEENDREFLSAASGCFGLLGVITHLTLEFDKMSYAMLQPAKIPVLLTIPPPPEMQKNLRASIPAALLAAFKHLTDEQLAAKLENAQAAFEQSATDDYYTEWFWFPYSDMCWVNCWNTSDDPAGVKEYPSNGEIYLQFFETFGWQVLQNAHGLNDKLIDLAGLQQATTTLISRYSMRNLPEVKPGESIKTWLPDGLHFRRCIQNIRILNCEVEIPLHASATDPNRPDYSNAQRAWWAAILHAYKSSKTAPQRMPLEMRIMGDSGVVMAPQRGNKLGTCCIEILTLETMRELWNPYAAEMMDTWLSYKDPNTGRRLATRPHWAKQWYDIKLNKGTDPWINRLRDEDYKDAIAEFKRIFAKIGARDGWTLADIKRRFSNDMLNELILFDVDIEEKPATRVVDTTASLLDTTGTAVKSTPVAAEVQGWGLGWVGSKVRRIFSSWY